MQIVEAAWFARRQPSSVFLLSIPSADVVRTHHDKMYSGTRPLLSMSRCVRDGEIVAERKGEHGYPLVLDRASQ